MRPPTAGIAPDPPPLAALRLPAFQWFLATRACSALASGAFQAVVAWQVYEISGSTLALSGLGLIQVLGSLVMSLLGGAVADTYNRRTVLLLAQAVPAVAATVILLAQAGGALSLGVLYGAVFLAALALPFENTARQALLPVIVPQALLVRGITISSTVQALASISGPALAGVLLAGPGAGAAYAVATALAALSVAVLLPLKASAPTGDARSGVHLDAVKAGLVFVRNSPVILSAMLLDLFAVVFGGAKALLPVYAADILRTGPTGYGLLAASIQAGALVMSLALLALPTPRQTGLTLLASVVAFGLATIVFGVSAWLPLSMLAYAGVGMADQLSVVLRNAIIQLSTPDALRGRVAAVNSVFVVSANQLGAVESGIVAAITNAVFAVASGGVACLAVVAVIAWRVPSLRTYRAEDGSAAG